MLSEISQAEKEKYHMMSFISVIKNQNKQKNLKKPQTHGEHGKTENKLMVARWDEGWVKR